MEQVELVRKLMALALVEVDEARLEHIRRDIERIVEMFNKIRDLDLPEDLEPLYTTYLGGGNLREDREESAGGPGVWESLDRKLEEGYLKAPRTL